MIIKYSENNSGGRRWLTNQDQQALRENGWEVSLQIFKLTKATKEFNSIKEALEEFERITLATVTDKGCNCCGVPHEFQWDGVYISESELLDYLEIEDKDEIIRRLKN